MKPVFFYWCIRLSILAVAMVSCQQLSRSNMEEIDHDLYVYLRSLNRIADFFLARKLLVDVIVDFGAFLENLNLKRVIRDKGKRLPVAIRVELEKLVRKNNELIEYFNGMLERDSNPEDKMYRNLTSLFKNDVWLNRLEPFRDFVGGKSQPGHFSKKYLRSTYSTWNKYIDDLSSANGTPLVEVSDSCLLSVATNPINYSDDEKQCDVHEYCRKFMHRGPDLGYALTHRWLILFVANYGRGCYVISPEHDKRLMNNFCSNMYKESLYITINEYKALDLLAEQILFCSLDGHSEFIKRPWLSEFLSLQTKEGCFPENRNNSKSLKLAARRKLITRPKRRWVVNNAITDKVGRFLMLDGRCNGHTTVLVGGALSSAVRFLLEKFY